MLPAPNNDWNTIHACTCITFLFNNDLALEVARLGTEYISNRGCFFDKKIVDTPWRPSRWVPSDKVPTNKICRHAPLTWAPTTKTLSRMRTFGVRSKVRNSTFRFPRNNINKMTQGNFFPLAKMPNWENYIIWYNIYDLCNYYSLLTISKTGINLTNS